MTRLLTGTHRINDTAKRRMVEALIKYVISFYMHRRKRNVENYKDVI